MTEQHKVADNCEVEGKSEKYDVNLYSAPFTLSSKENPVPPATLRSHLMSK